MRALCNRSLKKLNKKAFSTLYELLKMLITALVTPLFINSQALKNHFLFNFLNREAKRNSKIWSIPKLRFECSTKRYKKWVNYRI